MGVFEEGSLKEQKESHGNPSHLTLMKCLIKTMEHLEEAYTALFKCFPVRKQS